MEKVSVAVLTYNSEKFIKETLDSIVNQNYENIEIVIGDDCSTDNTVRILEEYKSILGSKMILLCNKKNLGITKNSNNVIKNCTGTYICWIGGDDIFFDNKIKLQVEYMNQNPNVGLSYHNIEIFRENRENILGYMNSGKKIINSSEDLIKNGCVCGACSIMHRKSIVEKMFDERIPISSDWLFWIQNTYKCKIGYIDKVLSGYRRHNDNITRKKVENIFVESEKSLEIVSDDNVVNSKIINYGYSRLYYSYTIKYLLLNDKKYKIYINKSVEKKIISIKQLTLYIIIKLKLEFLINSYFKKKNSL